MDKSQQQIALSNLDRQTVQQQRHHRRYCLFLLVGKLTLIFPVWAAYVVLRSGTMSLQTLILPLALAILFFSYLFWDGIRLNLEHEQLRLNAQKLRAKHPTLSIPASCKGFHIQPLTLGITWLLMTLFAQAMSYFA